MDSSSIRVTRSESPGSTGQRKSAPPLAEPGRVVAAEVVSKEGPKKFLLSVGRERVLVVSEKPLQVGDRLAVQVELEGGKLALRAVDSKAQQTSSLVQFLRASEGGDHKFGKAIQELVSALRTSTSQNAAKSTLLQALQSRIVSGALDGKTLANLMATGGTELEARLHQLATSADVDRSSAALVRDGASALLRQLLPAPENAQAVQARYGALFEDILRAQLSTRGAEPTSASLRRFFTAYARELLSAVSRLEARDAEGIRQRAQLTDGLQRALVKEDAPGFLAPILRRLLGGGALVREKLLSQLRQDLKGRLLAVLAGEPKGGERERVVQVLEAVEQEQARNLARSENSDGRQWSLAMLDGADLSTLKIFRRDPEHSEREGESGSMRFSIAVKFSKLGPIRADLSFNRNALSVRIVAAEVETVSLVQRDVEQLRSLLASAGNEVAITVAHGTEAQASVEEQGRDIRFLSENHLLDVSA